MIHLKGFQNISSASRFQHVVRNKPAFIHLENVWDVNMLLQETVNQNLLAHFRINGSDRRGSDRPAESPQSGNPNMLSFYLCVGKSKREKCIAACSSWEMETQNTPRKLFCLIEIKENCWEEEVCLQVFISRLRLPAPVISGRPCVYVCMCVFVQRAQRAALSWSDSGDL